MVKSKIPEEVLIQLEIQKGCKDKWTIMKLCEKLCDLIVARERSEKSKDTAIGTENKNSKYVQNEKHKSWQNRHLPSKQDHFHQRNPTSSAEAFVVSTTNAIERKMYSTKCFIMPKIIGVMNVNNLKVFMSGSPN